MIPIHSSGSEWRECCEGCLVALHNSEVLHYLDVLVPGPAGVEQILNVGLVLLGLAGAVGQHVLEEAVLQPEAGLQGLHHLAGAHLELAQQGATQLLGRRGEERGGGGHRVRHGRVSKTNTTQLN